MGHARTTRPHGGMALTCTILALLGHRADARPGARQLEEFRRHRVPPDPPRHLHRRRAPPSSLSAGATPRTTRSPASTPPRAAPTLGATGRACARRSPAWSARSARPAAVVQRRLRGHGAAAAARGHRVRLLQWPARTVQRVVPVINAEAGTTRLCGSLHGDLQPLRVRLLRGLGGAATGATGAPRRPRWRAAT